MNRDIYEIPANEIQVGNSKGEWPLLTELVPELPVPLLVGRDCLGFPMDLPRVPKTTENPKTDGPTPKDNESANNTEPILFCVPAGSPSLDGSKRMMTSLNTVGGKCSK